MSTLVQNYSPILSAFLLLALSNCGILFLNPKDGSQSDLLKYMPFLGVTSNSAQASTSAKDTISPTVLTAIPAVSSTNIPVNQKIIITFTEPVVAIENPITLTDSSMNSISGTVSWNNELLQYTLSSNLSYNKKYTVTISTGIKDAAGNSISESFTYNFTTELSSDNTSPTVIGTTPVSGTNSYNMDSSLSVVFSEPILISTFNLTNVTVTNAGNPVSIGVNANGSNGNIVPVGGWLYGTNYVVTIKKEIQDLVGNPMIADYSFLFSTQTDTNSPRVVSQIPEVYAVTPPAGLTVPGHSINDPIQIVFDKEILASSVTASSFTVKHGTTTIAGTYTVYPTTTSSTEAFKNYKLKVTTQHKKRIVQIR